METAKEKLRKKFDKEFFDKNGDFDSNQDWLFEWIWKEIEARESAIRAVDRFRVSDAFSALQDANDLRAKISRLEATLEAADEVINNMKVPVNTIDLIRYSDAIEKYNQLKSNQQSPNS